jgi:hypothetical protein
LGKVYGPDDVVSKRTKPIPDLPGRFPELTSPKKLEDMSKDIESIKVELKNIKQALKDHGVAIE